MARVKFASLYTYVFSPKSDQSAMKTPYFHVPASTNNFIKIYDGCGTVKWDCNQNGSLTKMEVQPKLDFKQSSGH